jgi:hypothetical protein
MRTSPRVLLGLAAALLAASSCETKKSSNPLSPTLAGPIPGVNITAPKPLEPSNGSRFTQGQTINLLLENASTNGERPIWQQLEVSLDPAFAQRVHYVERLDLGANGRTQYRLPVALEGGRGYYWRARALDGANTGPFSTAVIFNVDVPKRIEAPVAVSPIAGATIDSQTPTLVVRNTAVIGVDAPITVRFELAGDAGFSQMIAIWSVPRSGGETTSVAGSPLPLGGTFYWRAYASDGGLNSGYTVAHAFKTPAPPPDPTPVPTPDPTPAPPPTGGGGNCPGGDPLGIVTCQRSRMPGHMNDAQLVQFLRAVARNLNANGVGGGPFGILRKPGGTSCGGYSCDIICAGQGGGQRQYDVLHDTQGEQGPVWDGPLSPIRVDVCEAQ